MRIFLLAVCLILPSVYARAASTADVEAFAEKIERQLRSARYMEGTCTPIAIAGWEGFNTARCSYTVKDAKTGEVKTGLVVLLNPSARTLSAWILNACETIRPTENRSACSRRLYLRVLEQSGGQFPVAGVVYEDVLPRDGIQEAYGFASGVTAILKGVQHRRTKAFSSAELEAALSAAPIQTASESGFARIVGVTRKEYLKLNPAADVRGLNWLSIVREEHKKAINGERNGLLEAWLSANAP